MKLSKCLRIKYVSQLSMYILFAAKSIGQIDSSPIDSSHYEITGYLGGLTDGEKVIMMLSNSRGTGKFIDYLVPSDSASVQNGVFKLKGSVPEGPRRYIMTFSKHDGITRPYKELNLFINNGEKITIRSSDINKIQHGGIEHYVEIEGSPTNYSLFCLSPAEEVYYQSIGRLNNYAKKLTDSIGFNKEVLDGIYSIRNQVNLAYYYTIHWNDGKDPELKTAELYLPTVMSDFERSGNAPFWKAVYNHLTPAEKNSFHGKLLNDMIKLCIGEPFPSFSLPTPDGSTLSLKDIVLKSKVTLIHFWKDSPNEGECEPELKNIYAKYHASGLNIICFGAEKYNEKWKDAIDHYQMSPYFNVNDERTATSLWQDHGVDNNVLLDASGKIIAWNVKGVELLWALSEKLDNPLSQKRELSKN